MFTEESSYIIHPNAEGEADRYKLQVAFTTFNREFIPQLFGDLFLYALERFPKGKLLHVGHYRFKLYQLFVDRWRAVQRNPITPVPELPEKPRYAKPEILSEKEEAELKRSFFEEHPVDLTDKQQDVLFM